MRDSPSRTAEAVCFMRASDQRRDPARRILDDPYARLFLGPMLRVALAGVEAGGRFGERAEADLSPGLTAFILTRHRYIDDALSEALEAGIDQLLVLGAGYDTRAWRFADRLRGVPVFEVDHPSTEARKLSMLRDATLPEVDLRRVAIDFHTDQLDAVLRAAGFRPGATTFVVWEGVSMYLTRAAVKHTLDTLHGLVGPGSELLMDWWYMVDAPDAVSTVLRMSPQMLHLLGEPITFGIHPEDVGAFTARHGWRAAEVAEAPLLEERYIRDPRRVFPAMYVTRLSKEPSGHAER